MHTPSHLLFLHVQASDVMVSNIGPLLHELNGGIALGRQYFHDAVTVAVKSYRGIRLENLSIQRAENTHEVV